jgi:hypothetical protein
MRLEKDDWITQNMAGRRVPIRGAAYTNMATAVEEIKTAVFVKHVMHAQREFKKPFIKTRAFSGGVDS